MASEFIPHEMPVLPGASQAAHVTLSGGALGGLDVVRVNDTSAANPEKIEVGARVELQDGAAADVVEVSGKLLSKFGGIGGGVKVRLANGEIQSKSSGEISRVIAAPSGASIVHDQTAQSGA